MKKPTSKTIDAVVIFLCGLIAVVQLNLPETPLVEEESIRRFVAEHGQNKAISIIHLAEQNSAITQRQISELNRLHQRHDHLFVVAALNNERHVKAPCQQLKKESELRYNCISAPELHHYDKVIPGHYTQTSNITIHIKGNEHSTERFYTLTGYQDYQQLIQLLELDY